MSEKPRYFEMYIVGAVIVFMAVVIDEGYVKQKLFTSCGTHCGIYSVLKTALYFAVTYPITAVAIFFYLLLLIAI